LGYRKYESFLCCLDPRPMFKVSSKMVSREFYEVLKKDYLEKSNLKLQAFNSSVEKQDVNNIDLPLVTAQ
jgi:hypothetical protein